MLNNPALQCISRLPRLRFEAIPILGEIINSCLEEGSKTISLSLFFNQERKKLNTILFKN